MIGINDNSYVIFQKIKSNTVSQHNNISIQNEDETAIVYNPEQINPFVPPSIHLKEENNMNNNTYFLGLWWGLNEFMTVDDYNRGWRIWNAWNTLVKAI